MMQADMLSYKKDYKLVSKGASYPLNSEYVCPRICFLYCKCVSVQVIRFCHVHVTICMLSIFQ